MEITGKDKEKEEEVIKDPFMFQVLKKLPRYRIPAIFNTSHSICTPYVNLYRWNAIIDIYPEVPQPLSESEQWALKEN